HPGVLAVLLDDITARTSMANAPGVMTFTANFQLEYPAPIPTGSFIVMDSWITAIEGRKVFVASRALDAESGQTVALAKSLFI
ncbi:hypothetical protein GQ54DRAFT_250380, partial [Martensiomyces pterosporus]